VTALKFEGARVTQEYGGDTWLSLRVKDGDAARRLCDTVNTTGKLYVAEVKQYRERRSLDANAYFWVLCGKLAAVLRMSMTEIYRWCVRDIGDNFQIVPIRKDGIGEWERIWTAKGLGWIVEDLGPCRNLPGYHYMASYYGSSLYTTDQMSRLIDVIVQACQEQGIETATPDELANMISLYGGEADDGHVPDVPAV